MSNIKTNLNGLEIMVFFWNSLISKEKVSETFINDLCSMKEFSYIYNEDFSNESLRRVLSALNNKEPFTGNKVERKYYSNNLMVLEYVDQVQPKIDTIKKLNLEKLTSKITQNIEIIIIPGTSEGIEKYDDKVIVDFFKLRLSGDMLFIGEEKLQTSIENLI